MEHNNVSWIDSGRLILTDNYLLELFTMAQFKRAIRYTPLSNWKRALNDVVIEDGEIIVIAQQGGNICKEYPRYNPGDNNDLIDVVRDGYIFGESDPMIIRPRLIDREHLSKAVQRKLNKL